MIERNDNESDEDFQARLVRVKDLVFRISAVVDGYGEADALQALSIVFARECIVGENPDRTFLQCLDGALTVFRDLTNAKYRNEDKGIS